MVETLMLPMRDAGQDVRFRGGITFQLIGDQYAWDVPQSMERLAKEPFCRLPITPALHQDIKGMAILIDRAPQVMMLALDGQHHLVKRPCVSALRLAPAQRIGAYR